MTLKQFDRRISLPLFCFKDQIFNPASMLTASFKTTYDVSHGADPRETN